MFIELTTTKGEKFNLNIKKILMMFQQKKCTSIVLDDGSQYDVVEDYDYLCRMLSRD